MNRLSVNSSSEFEPACGLANHAVDHLIAATTTPMNHRTYHNFIPAETSPGQTRSPACSDISCEHVDKSATRDTHHRRPLINMRDITKLATLNCRSLNSGWKQGELTAEAKRLNLAAVGIQEHRIQCEDDLRHLDVGCGWHFVHASADKQGNGGVGLLMSPRTYASLDAAHLISQRILRFTFTCQNKRQRKSHPKLDIIVCYSPTSVSSDPDIESFYSDMQNTVDSTGRHAFLAILGDWNARLKTSALSPWVYSNSPNRNSAQFSDFLSANELFSSNTMFRKRLSRLYTHRGPQHTLSQIDHIVCRQKYRNSVRNCNAFTFRPFATDHRMVVADVKLSLRSSKPTRPARRRYEWSALSDPDVLSQFRICCTNRFAELANTSSDHRENYTSFVDSVATAAEKCIPPVAQSKKRVPWEDTAVKSARAHLASAKAAHRRYRTHATRDAMNAASKALARQYSTSQMKYIEGQLENIQAADESRKPSEVWKAINNLSGRKSKASVKIKAKSPADRLAGWKTHFENLLNNKTTHSDNFTVKRIFSGDGDILHDIPTGEITMEEVLAASRQLKKGKACGTDGIPPEVLRDPELLCLLHPILNSVFITCQPPSEFLLNRIIALPKKGDLSQYGSYRGISLMSCAAKLFNRILLNRIREPVEKLLRTNQNGFRRHRSTLEPILTLRRLIEEMSARQNVSSCAVFVDFAKAFDSVDRECMFQILSAYGIPSKIVNAIRCVYDNSHSFVSTQEGDTAPFPVQTGVLQGDTLAPFLFIIVLDYVLRGSMTPEFGLTLKRRQSSRHPAVFLTDLDFADDIALLSDTIKGAQALLSALECAAKEVGLLINQSKTKSLVINTCTTNDILSLSSGPVDFVDDYCYLGSWIRTTDKDIASRKAKAWAAANKLWKLWKAPNLCQDFKRKIFRATVESVLLYGSECWTLTVAQQRSLDGTYTRLLRKALNVSYSSHTTNISLYGSIPPVSSTIRSRRLHFAGHCYRRDDQPVHLALFYNPPGNFKPGGHRRLNYIRSILRDTGLSSTSDISSAMNDRSIWQTICDNVGVDVEAHAPK